MLFITIGLLIILFIILVVFSFPEFSPIPYFPSNKKDLPLILKALNLRNDQLVVDMGAGDGLVTFFAAQKAKQEGLNTQFIAIEYNFILVLILFAKWFFHTNKGNIKIVWADMFSAKFPQDITKTFYLYVSPWFMGSLYKKLRKEVGKFEIVSYFYPVPKIKPAKTLKGINKIFVYKR